MSESGGNDGRRVKLEAALREWPDAEDAGSSGSSSSIWPLEERARSVLDRVGRGDLGRTIAETTDDDLIAAPFGSSLLASSTEEGSPESPESAPAAAPSTRARDRRSLKDLAKLAPALTPPTAPGSSLTGVRRATEAAKDDSGIVDLAAAARSDPDAATRAQSTPLASHGLFDEEPTPASGPEARARAASVAPGTQDEARREHAATRQPDGKPDRKKSRAGAALAIVLGGMVAMGATAAATVFYMKSQAPAPTSEPVAMTPPPPSTASPPPDRPEEGPDRRPEPKVSEAPRASEPVTSPESLPTATPDKLAAGAPPPRAPASKGAEHEPALRPATTAGGNDAPAAGPTGGAADLGAAMKKEVGDDSAPKTPAAQVSGAGAAGGIPQKPSQGAVTGALGVVLPQARACLGPDDPISRATIVFGSDGAARSVSVSGGAAGRPAEACIQKALMNAKVQPFAEPTYTANVTVRHN